MSKKGPKPKDKPEPFDGQLEMPDDLDPVGVQAWLSVVADLTTLGTLHQTDANMIALYARTFSMFMRIEDQLSQEDLTIASMNGVRINPLVTAHASLVPRVRQLLSDLGLSPRTRGKTEDDKGVDPKWAGY